MSLKNGLDKYYIIIYSHIDHHLMKYSLVISTSKIYTSLCEAESRLEEKQILNLTQNDSEDDLSLDDRLDVNIIIFIY